MADDGDSPGSADGGESGSPEPGPSDATDGGAPDTAEGGTPGEAAPDAADDSTSEAAAGAAEASPLGEVAGTVGAGAKTVLGPLVASKIRIGLLVLVLTGGLIGAGFALGVLGAPQVTGVQNDFGNVTENETVIETNVSVQNPNPIDISLGGVTIDYRVSMNDVQVANGTKNGVSIEQGNSTMQLETTLYNDKIPPWWASHVRNDERTSVGIEATVSSSTIGQSRTFTRSRRIQTDVLGQFASQEDRPINGNLPVVEDPLLIVRETDASWGTVTREETPLNMDFTAFNPHAQPYAISELRYNVTMNQVLVAQGATEDPFVIPGGATNTLHATTAIQNGRLDEWWVSHLDESVYGHQVTKFRIDFTAVVELPNGETTTVPLDDLTYEEWIGTDLLGEGGDVGVPPNGSAGGDDGGITDGSDGGNDTSGSDGGGLLDDGSSDGSGSGDGGGSGGNDSSGDDSGGVLGRVLG